MNLFSAVKAHISTIDAAERYGIEVRRNGMALCPFHNDRTPSLYVADDHYHCFGCGEHGDSIDLAAKLYDLPMHKAAQKLAADFGIAVDEPISKDIQDKRRRKNEAQKLRENEHLCFSLLREYSERLEHWKAEYAPRAPEEQWDDHFVEACKRQDHVEYLLDQLISGDSYERAEVVEMMLRDNRLRRLSAHLTKARKEEDKHVRQEI